MVRVGFEPIVDYEINSPTTHFFSGLINKIIIIQKDNYISEIKLP